MKAGQQQGQQQGGQDDIKNLVKLGMAEFMKDSEDIRKQESVDTTKLGVAQVAQDMQNGAGGGNNAR